MPHRYLFANWKNRLTIAQSVELAKRIVESPGSRGLPFQLVLCPTFVALTEVARIVNGTNIELAAQNLVWDDQFTFTGETHAKVLVEIGCRYVIIGHSERRIHLGETDEMVERKVQAALSYDLIPVICVGERFEDRSRREEVVTNQLLRALAGVDDFKRSIHESLVVAYEPAWAISTSSVGIPLTATEANRMHQLIREVLTVRISSSVVRETSVAYGGSMSPENIEEYLSQPEIDGGLVGSASQSIHSVLRLIEIANRIYSTSGR